MDFTVDWNLPADSMIYYNEHILLSSKAEVLLDNKWVRCDSLSNMKPSIIVPNLCILECEHPIIVGYASILLVIKE